MENNGFSSFYKERTMKNHANFPLLIKVAAVAAALSLQGAAMAAATDASSPAPVAAEQSATAPSGQGWHADKNWRRGGHYHARMAMRVPGYGALGQDAVKVLNLTSTQSKLLADAQAAEKEARKTRFETMRAERKERFEQLKAGKIDPHAAAKQRDSERSKAVEARNSIESKWFAVWDSLDATQQQKVATLLSERAARWSDAAHHGHGAKSMHRQGQHPMRPAPDEMPAS
jgi:hypothetical protein